MLSLTAEEKKIILNAYKEKHTDIECLDEELLKIINSQSFKIWHDKVNAYSEIN